MNYHPVVLFLFATAVLSKIRISPSHEDDIIVKTNHGQLRGRRDETISGTPYFSFQGIPYATPPVKSKRFEPPKSMSWRGIWNATYIRPNCTQLSLKSEDDIKPTMNGDEDCLYMNIYTTELPDKENRTQRPVLVWIHGGGFIIGAGEMPSVKFDPFINQKVVTVNFNYSEVPRSGFLSTGDDVIPGNMGVKDLILALRWVQENIARFSGDPKSVTIMGESAGAALVSYLIESPLAKGAAHADELSYVFEAPFVNKTQQDKKTSKTMTTLWTNFIKTGNPTPNKTELGITWTRSSQQNDYTYLEINNKLSLSRQIFSPHKKDIDFWNNLYKTCGGDESE